MQMHRTSVQDHVDLEGFVAGVERRNPGQTEFIQAVREVAEDIFDFMQDKVQCPSSPSSACRS